MSNQMYVVTYSGNKFYSVHRTMESAQRGAKECEHNQLAGGNSHPCVEIKTVQVS